MASPSVVEVEDLIVDFKRPGIRTLPFRAVDGVSLTVSAGEAVGLVGESGSGKSTLGRAILGLNAVSSGTIRFDGRDITNASRRTRRELSKHLQVVFQDPYSSLNPSRTIGQTLAEPLLVHRHLGRAETAEQIRVALDRVGLPTDSARRYPSNFSGGQRQRIAIARALLLTPRFVIFDEPVSALDLSMQAQILNLLSDLRRELSLGCLFISHDMAVVRYITQRVVVLYRGRIMEEGPVDRVCGTPAHPYTRALISAVPVPDPTARRARDVKGPRRALADTSVSGAVGCPFVGRCPYVIERCRVERPVLAPSPVGTRAACHRAAELPAFARSSLSHRDPGMAPGEREDRVRLQKGPDLTIPGRAG